MPKNRRDETEPPEEEVSSEVELELEILESSGGRAAGAGADPGGRERRRRIVVVDRDPALSSYARRCIEERSTAATEVVEAEGGAEALKMARSGRVDLLVYDAGIAPMGWSELIAELRTDPGLDSTPVLLTIDALGRADRQRLARMRAVGLLQKPFNARKLCEGVERLLSEEGR